MRSFGVAGERLRADSLVCRRVIDEMAMVLEICEVVQLGMHMGSLYMLRPARLS